MENDHLKVKDVIPTKINCQMENLLPLLVESKEDEDLFATEDDSDSRVFKFE